MLPGSVKTTLFLLLMLASQEVISQERGRQSSPARASQGDDDSPMSLKAKDERTQDLLPQKTGREQVPLETPSDEPASRRRGMAGRRATKNTKRLSNRNPKKEEVEKTTKKRQDPGRRKQSPGKSNSRKKNVRKRKVEEKETKTKAKKKQRKKHNKTVKKKLKFSKNPTKKNKPVKNKAKKRKSKKNKRRKNRGGAKKPKKGQRKKGKQGVRSNTKKSKPKIKVGRTKPKPRLLFQGGKCGSSTRVGVGEVLAVEASDSGKAVECKHTIRARKGVTLKMTCPRFSLSPGGCKEEKVIIREVGKGKGVKKKYCKSENPGEDVSVAAPKAVTFLHERTQQKGTRCSDGFLCLFSATEISGTVSECRKKYKLREGETMIVTPTTFRDKVSCKYSFRSPPGTVLSLRCPSFNLNARGCGRERVIVREKKPKYKEKFCKENNPAVKRGQTASNYVIITHKRKKLKNNECERGFWCQVSAVRGQPVTNKPTVGQPVSDTPSIGHPVTAKPTVGQPVTDQPTMAQPVTVKPTIGQSMTGQSTMVQPVTTKPTVGQSVTDKPTMAQPVTAKPTAGQFVTDNPTLTQLITARPTVGQSLTDKPTMGKPVTDKPISPITNMPPVSTTETDPPTVQQPTTSQIPEVIASTATPSQSIADTPVQQPTTSQIPEVIASTTTPSQSIADTPVADVAGGFADLGTAESEVADVLPPFVIDCEAVLCMRPEEFNCTEIPGTCCSDWICGDLPRKCVLETGETYEIGESWINDCEVCQCVHSTRGARASCHKRFCIPPPHYECLEVERPGECCPDYNCASTTCKFEGRYYRIGDKITSEDYCQTCVCEKGESVAVLECDEPTTCEDPPSPDCLPAYADGQCCPIGWDCTDVYLMTVPKVGVRGGQSSVCVFLEEEPPVEVKLSLSLTFEREEVAVEIDERASESVICTEISIPAGDSDVTAILSVEGTIGTVAVSEELPIRLVSVSKTFVQTDKYLYEEGQAVKFRVLSVEGAEAAISYDNLEEVWITSPANTRLAQWRDVNNSLGLVQLEFPLAEQVKEGDYTIHVKTGGRVTKKNFKVEPYTLPRFIVTVIPPPYTLVTDDIIKVTVCADYTYGQPVTGSGILRVKKNRYYYYENDQEKDVLNIEIPTFTGCADVDVDTSQINTEGFGFIGKLLLTANVTEEGTELVVSGSASIQLATMLLSFTLISRGKDAKPGLPFEMQIQARYPDDTGAPAVEVAACVETTCKDFTTDGEGVFTVIVPPHLVKPQGYLKVSLTEEGNNKGNLGILHPSSHYFNFDLYYSKSNSSLSLAIPTDALACTSSQDISLSLPVSFVANNMARALMRVQVMSRSQVVLTQTFEQDLAASPLNFDNDLLLAPMEDLEAGFVRGTFDLQLDIPHYASPTVRVLIWYSTGDGEVIAASGSVEVSSCLPNTASLSWSPSDTAAPKDEVEVTITSAPNSICGLGVVDRSVEILSRGKAGSLTKDSVFNIFKNTEPNHWLNSQVDDYSYCSGKPFPPFYDYFGMEEFRRKRSYYRPHYSLYIDALSAFNDAAFLVISDLTIQTRPCEKQDFGGFFPIGIGGGDYAEDGTDYGAGADYGAGVGVDFGDYGEITEEEAAAPPPLLEEDTPSEDVDDVNKEVDEGDEAEARTYFPETWLWDLVVVGDTGSSSVPVVVPDTVTEWVGEAVCVNPTFGIGLSPPTTLTAFTPFFLDLTMPPSVRRQERVPLRVSVFNYLDQTLPVSVTLTESPSFTSDEYSQSVCVPANSMQVAEYIVVPSEAGDINLTFSASVTSASAQCSAGSDLPEKSDVMVKALKVVFEGVERERVNSVFICGGDASQTWNLETPVGVIEGSERVFVSVSADLLGPTIENLGHLVNMPYGCGEQNMINFVPNIYVVQYLNSIGQGNTEIVDKAINFMTIGYQKELNYRREDGSYSAFGDSDSEGSTWLTAYVLKSFAQASEYITIDEEDLEVSADWLLNQQMEDGCFESVGMVHHKAMKGGLGSTTSSAVPLSAYVIIALSEAGEDASLSSAVSCVTADTAAVDVYSESLKSYALALSSPADAPGHITAAYDLLIADAEVEGSIWVESASYTVLAMLKADPTAYAAQSVDLVRRISQHRNSLGAFHSTQDSVLALQAFAAYSKAFPASDTNLELEVTAETSFSMQITTANQLVVQTRDIEDTLPYNVTVTPSGTGCAVFMVVHQFHIPEIAASSTFDMTVTSTSESCIFANVTICVSYLVVGEDSNMVIIEVDLESGYVAIEHDLERLQNEGVIKKYEQDEPGLVELYLESVTAKEVCLTVGVVRVIWVEDVKPGTVSIYDYYQNPDNKLVKPLIIQRPDCVVMEAIQEEAIQEEAM